MAIITSAKTGQWSTAATWDLNRVPLASDDIIIATGHTVTAFGNFISEKSLTVHGTFNQNGEFQTGNGNGKDCTVTVSPGGVFNNEGWWYCENGTYAIKGSADNFAVIKGSGRMDKALSSTSPKIVWDCEYMRLQITNALLLPLGNSQGSLVPSMHFSNCVFDGYTLLTFGASNTPVTTNLVFNNCDFRSASRISILCSSGATPGLRHMRNCTFRSATTRASISTSTGGTWDFTGSVTINHMGSAGGTFAAAMTWDNAFFANDCEAAASTIINNYPGSRAKESFIHIGPNTPSNNMPNAITIAMLDSCVCEVTGTDASVQNAVVPLAKSSCNNTLFVGTGDLFNFNGTYTSDADLYNNTVVRLDSSAGSLLALKGGKLTNASANGTRVRNNLHVGVSAVANMVRTMSTANTIAIGSDYNCPYNTTDPYQSGKVINTLTAAHDFVANPQFFDSSRRFEKWVQSVTGNASATYKDGYDILANKNGYDPVTKTQKATSVPAATLADFLAYMREGFTPTNMALETAGEGGTYVGAVLPNNPIPHDYAIVIASVPSSVVIGGTATLTVTLTDAGVPVQGQIITWSIESGGAFGTLTPSGSPTDSLGKTTAVFTAVAKGATVIKATFGTTTASTTVNVRDVPVPGSNSLAWSSQSWGVLSFSALTWTKL